MIMKNESLRRSVELFFIAIMFIAPPLLAEVFFGGEVPAVLWYIRWIDIIDITIMTIVYFILFIYLAKHSIDETKNILFARIFTILLSLFIGGHFMHFATNAINTYAYEVRGYKVGQDIPNDIATVLYFLDEDLSHYIMFISMFALLLVIFISRFQILIKGENFHERIKLNDILDTSTSIIFGVAFAISAIEARKAYFVILLEIIVLAIIMFYSYKFEKKSIKVINQDTILRVIFMSFSLSLLTFLAYYLYFGGFIEPSEMFRRHTY